MKYELESETNTKPNKIRRGQQWIELTDDTGKWIKPKLKVPNHRK